MSIYHALEKIIVLTIEDKYAVKLMFYPKELFDRLVLDRF